MGDRGLTANARFTRAYREGAAPTYWQNKAELTKDLRGQVRRMIQHLGLEGWQKQIPATVQDYAVLHYRKP